jgi:hypothetical protein
VVVSSEEPGWKGQSTAQTGPDGRFLFASLMPGSADVDCWPADPVAVLLRAGEETEVLLALRRQPVVHGRVLSAGLPVTGARVEAELRLGNGGWIEDVSTTSSATGDYELQLGEPGEYVLSARDPPFDGALSEPAVLTVGWDARELVDLHFGTGRIEGLVVDAATGQPIAKPRTELRRLPKASSSPAATPGAEFRLFGSGDADGRFVFERVPPGDYLVAAQAKGYSWEEQAPVHVASDATAGGLRFALGPGTLMKGTVRMASGKPLLPDLRVGIEAGGGDSMNYSTDVKPNGEWSSGLSCEPGPYVLTVFQKQSVIMSSLDPPALATREVQLEAGETEVVDFVLEG